LAHVHSSCVFRTTEIWFGSKYSKPYPYYLYDILLTIVSTKKYNIIVPSYIIIVVLVNIFPEFTIRDASIKYIGISIDFIIIITNTFSYSMCASECLPHYFLQIVFALVRTSSPSNKVRIYVCKTYLYTIYIL